MIPQNAIRESRSVAPWADDFQVEQDLVITRALIHIYNDPYLAKEFAFRGGPIGPALDAIRTHLDPWLGIPRRSRKDERFTLIYHYESETQPVSGRCA
ncbi:MAG: hypothetical protein HYV97_15610 [Bdellovibrio sp.]|nr:hypothetical protein [Bdellovibrio sp.]